MEHVIRVLIVDDDPLVRSALSLMIGGQNDIEVVAEAADGRAGVDLARRERPDVVLMDIRMPVLSGLEATRELRADPEAAKVIILTTFAADDYVVEALAVGADGFVLKDTPPVDIIAAIRQVSQGQSILSPSATATLIRRVRQDPSLDRVNPARALTATLTERELQVAVAVGRGFSNAEIAGELHLSVPTVKAHVSRLFDKLQTTNRVQIAICVHDAGLT